MCARTERKGETKEYQVNLVSSRLRNDLREKKKVDNFTDNDGEKIVQK